MAAAGSRKENGDGKNKMATKFDFSKTKKQKKNTHKHSRIYVNGETRTFVVSVQKKSLNLTR